MPLTDVSHLSLGTQTLIQHMIRHLMPSGAGAIAAVYIDEHLRSLAVASYADGWVSGVTAMVDPSQVVTPVKVPEIISPDGTVTKFDDDPRAQRVRALLADAILTIDDSGDPAALDKVWETLLPTINLAFRVGQEVGSGG